MERDPIMLFSCTIGFLGARAAPGFAGSAWGAHASPTPVHAPARRSRLHRLAQCTHAYARGSPGLTLPFFLGDGGAKAEADATSYAYRIKHVYPPKDA
jgi:hypothetical protein